MTTTISNLPELAVINILYHLPDDQLIHCRRVSKKWKNILDSIVKLHCIRKMKVEDFYTNTRPFCDLCASILNIESHIIYRGSMWKMTSLCYDCYVKVRGDLKDRISNHLRYYKMGTNAWLDTFILLQNGDLP